MLKENLKRENKPNKGCGCKKGKRLDSYCISCIVAYIVLGSLFAAFLLFAKNVDKNQVSGVMLFLVNLADGISNSLNNFKSLPLIIILIPLVGGPIEMYFFRRRENARDMAIVYTTVLTFFLILALFPQVLEGTMRFEIQELWVLESGSKWTCWDLLCLWYHPFYGFLSVCMPMII